MSGTGALKAEYRAEGFACWKQFVAMLLCQLAQARSLREITDGKTGDVTVSPILEFPQGSIVAMDRGYVDCHLFTR